MQLQHGKNNTQTNIYLATFVLKNNGILLFKNKEYHIPRKNSALLFYCLMLTVKLLAKKRLSIRSGARVLPVMNL